MFMSPIQWPCTQHLTRSWIARTRCSAAYPYVIRARRRGYADRPPSSPTRYQPEPDPSPNAQNLQNEFVGHTMFAFRNLRKVLLYAGYGTLILGLVTATAFEGAHFWIEHQMCEVADEDARRWGWELDGWTGGEGGGTSPALGFFGRHAVRAAWFSLRYGTRLSGTSATSQVSGSREKGSLNVVESDLESARVYLEAAIARVRDDQGRVRADKVGLDLLERHAAVLERIGTRAALAKAREEYRQVLHGRAGQRVAEARLAVKLGDLSERLGDSEGAISWWARGIDLVQDNASTASASASAEAASSSTAHAIPASSLLGWSQDQSTNYGVAPVPWEPASVTLAFPTRPPSSPLAQRTLAAAMLSISAYYSKRKMLQEAKRAQEHAIPLIEAMVPKPETSTSVPRVAQSPGQTLHHMYLLHRKSVLAIHHGEVTYALATLNILPGTSPNTGPLMDLLTAASSSEVVAQILTGQSLSHPDLPSSYLRTSATPTVTARAPQRVPRPPSSNTPLMPVYLTSAALGAPARSILRDARLTAAESWDLCGVLYSEWGSEAADVKALECFERALGWVGDPGENVSREGMRLDAWQSIWGRYVEAREKMKKHRGELARGNEGTN